MLFNLIAMMTLDAIAALTLLFKGGTSSQAAGMRCNSASVSPYCCELTTSATEKTLLLS
jgi:hypothetical protein